MSCGVRCGVSTCVNAHPLCDPQQISSTKRNVTHECNQIMVIGPDDRTNKSVSQEALKTKKLRCTLLEQKTHVQVWNLLNDC